jgi:hypothetical protein
MTAPLLDHPDTSFDPVKRPTADCKVGGKIEGGLGMSLGKESKGLVGGRKSFLSCAQEKAVNEVCVGKQHSLSGVLRANASVGREP